MSELSPDRAGHISSQLIRGGVDDDLLHEIASLDRIPDELAENMLQVLADTDKAGIRNVLAVALAQAGVEQAVPCIIHLLKQPKTAGARATLLYALNQIDANLDLATLTNIILTDTWEAKEEALILLENLLESGATRPAIEDALRSIARRYPLGSYSLNTVAMSAAELLREALTSRPPSTRRSGRIPERE
jgi:hypothetical protein